MSSREMLWKGQSDPKKEWDELKELDNPREGPSGLGKVSAKIQ